MILKKSKIHQKSKISECGQKSKAFLTFRKFETKFQIKLIIFDFDGTLIDSRKANLAVGKLALRHFNVKLKNKNMKDFYTLSSKDIVKHMFPLHKRTRAFRFIKKHRKDFFHLMRLNKNVMYMLRYLKKNKYKIAMATNRGKSTYKLLKLFKLNKYFDFIATAGMIRKHKPWPHQINYVIRKMRKKGFKFRKDEILYVGDSYTDSIAAKRAGVKCVIYRNNRLKTDYHINDFKKLKLILRKLNN